MSSDDRCDDCGKNTEHDPLHVCDPERAVVHLKTQLASLRTENEQLLFSVEQSELARKDELKDRLELRKELNELKAKGDIDVVLEQSEVRFNAALDYLNELMQIKPVVNAALERHRGRFLGKAGLAADEKLDKACEKLELQKKHNKKTKR